MFTPGRDEKLHATGTHNEWVSAQYHSTSPVRMKKEMLSNSPSTIVSPPESVKSTNN